MDRPQGRKNRQPTPHELAIARGLSNFSGRPHTHRPAFLTLMAKAAGVGVALGAVLAIVTAAVGYVEWTQIAFQIIAIAAVSALPVGLGTRAVTHATWHYIKAGGTAGATPEEFQTASRMMIAIGSAAIGAWLVLVLARWLDTGQVVLL